MLVVHKIIFLLIFVSVFSCGKSYKESSIGNSTSSSVNKSAFESKELFPSEYVKWVQNKDNGFLKEQTNGDMTFSLLYKPIDYIICQEERKDDIKTESVKTKTAELGGMDYYDLKISLDKEQGELLKYKIAAPAEYNERVKYFAFDMQKDVMMIHGSDTISCAMFHFEREYDAAPEAIFLLAFPKHNKIGKRTILFHDKVFGNGIIKFDYSGKEISRLPKLKTTVD